MSCSASREVIEHLVDAARPFIFDTALAPGVVPVPRSPLCGCCRRSPTGPRLSGRGHANSRRWPAPTVWTPQRRSGAVVSVLIGAPAAAVAAADLCAALGVRVGCFRPPSVPDGVSRLRLTARADLTAADFARAADALAAVARIR